MKLTKSHLRKIIKEEFSAIIDEDPKESTSEISEGRWEIEQLDDIATRLHDLTMWATTQGYKGYTKNHRPDDE